MKHIPTTQSGFSLLQVSILITVMAILSTSMMPGLIAGHKEKLAERVLRDLFALQEAAEAYHHQHGIWPGEESSCTASASSKGMMVLVAQGFLSQSLREPLSQKPYRLGYMENEQGCALEIALPEDTKLGTKPGQAQNILNTFAPLHCPQGEEQGACSFRLAPPTLSDALREKVDQTLQPRLDDVADLWAEKVRKQKEEAEEASTYEIRLRPGDAEICASGYRAKELEQQHYHAGHRNSLELIHGNGAMCPPVPEGWAKYTCYLHCEKN